MSWIEILTSLLKKCNNDSVTIHLFLHLLTTSDGCGVVTTTLRKLANELNTSVDKIRVRLTKLQQGGIIEIPQKSHKNPTRIPQNKTTISICNFDSYTRPNLEQSHKNPTRIPQESHNLKEKVSPTPPIKENINKNLSSTTINAHAHEGFIEALKCDRTWGEMIAMRYSLSSLEALDTWLDKFSLDHQCRGIVHDNISDAKRHFNDWLRIQLQIIKRNESEIDTKNRRRYLEVTATTEKDYSTTFQVERLP